MMRGFVAAAVVVAVGSSLAFAQSTAIGQRKELMKSAGAAAKEGGAMARGEAAFDLAKAQAALKTYANVAAKVAALFPDDSKTGGETTAAPAIWEKKAEFTALLAKWGSDAAAAAAAAKDEASFKTEWPKVMGNCGACHKAFRVEKK
jgi:cytochrome c556